MARTGLMTISGAPVFVNNAGLCVSSAGVTVAGQPIRFSPTSGGPVLLGNLGTNASGGAAVLAFGADQAGAAVGIAEVFADGNTAGSRAVCWNAGAIEPTQLGQGTYRSACAYAINAAGMVAGIALDSNNTYALRWQSGTYAVLNNAGLGTGGRMYSRAVAMNEAGTVVGHGEVTLGGVVYDRALRWNAGGTGVTVLGFTWTNPSTTYDSQAVAINAAGIVVGHATADDEGRRPVRWDASGTATELGNLGLSWGSTYITPVAINDAGTAVGNAHNYAQSSSKVDRAVRWDASAVAATELGNLGTDVLGITTTNVYKLSNTGVIVGYALKYSGGVSQGEHAVMWGLDGNAVDLNTLIDPAGGWTLTRAKAISPDGQWIAGEGKYDPDGAGPLLAYFRLWVMSVSNPADFNGDGKVNGRDFLAWQSHYPMLSGAAKTDGDANGDGKVNGQDFLIWQTQYKPGL